MIIIKVSSDAKKAQAFLVQVKGTLTQRRELNEVLADRLASDLRAHFVNKNRKPNRLGGRRSNFWASLADVTSVESVTDTGATVAVADERLRVHLFGGTIVPKFAKALTIPLVKEAYGESAKSYRQKSGHRLFTVPGRKALFEKTDQANASESRVSFTRARDRSFGVKLAARQGIRAVFLLLDQVKINKDPDAIPANAAILRALQEEADDFLQGINQGGLV